jgi:NTP pyrophosphatase (non-canonical NTP hydrolase)
MDIEKLQQHLAAFAKERDWGRFHSPKNLAMALNVEAGELLELFQWLTEEQSRNPDSETREHTRQELADILIYLIRLAGELGIDLEKAVEDKMRINAEKYPVELAKGNATKYTRR